MNISMAEEISQQNSDLEIIRHRVREIEKNAMNSERGNSLGFLLNFI